MSWRSNFRVTTLLVLWFLCPCGTSRAALDPEKSTPYQLQVVLHLGDSRLLTTVFRERIERGLHDYLQAAFGNLARVQVVRTHPRLAHVLDKGLQHALDNWKERSGTKTHFVLIDYVNGYYEIQTRQHDGLTGQASPIVRTDRTRDRAFAARAAAFLVEQDFGIVGTFDAWPSDATSPVSLQLKGGDLKVLLDRWVQKGDVFQVVRIPTGDQAPELVDWALAKVQDPPGEDGVCSCLIFWRYVPEGNPAGYRCMKIATVKGPLRLRVVRQANGKRQPVPAGVRVEVRRNSFNPAVESNPLRGTLDAFGGFDSGKINGDKGIFDKMALVSLVEGADATLAARMPVALVDDQPVTIVGEFGKGQEGDLTGFRRARWKSDVTNSYAVQTNSFKDLQALAADPKKRVETIAKAKATLQRSRSEHDALTDRRKELKAPRDTPGELDKVLQAQDRMLKFMRDGEKTLEQFITNQEDTLAVEANPRRRELLEYIERGKLLEEKAEYGQAIELYEKVTGQTEFPFPEVTQHLEDLKKRWRVLTDEHQKARDFTYKVWPKLETAGLEAGIAEAVEALKACKDAGDDLTPRRLLLGIQDHVVRLGKEAEKLKEGNPDDENKIKVIQKVAAALQKLSEKVGELFPQLGPTK